MEASSEIIGFNFGEFSYQPLSPTSVSMYLWDACKRGKLFDSKTYESQAFTGWMKNFLEKTLEDVTLPPHFNKVNVVERLKEEVINGLTKSGVTDSFNSTDPEDIESIKKLVEESKEGGREGFNKFIKFLKQDIFPPILWMEFNRFNRVFVDTTQFMMDRLERWFRLRPTGTSRVRERSRLTQAMFMPCRNLVYHYSNGFLSLFKMILFMELWSCETESELFTDKLWTFEKVDFNAFEAIFFDFHNSISGLRQAILEFKPETVEIDFTRPTEWAFKQLVQMVEV